MKAQDWIFFLSKIIFISQPYPFVCEKKKINNQKRLSTFINYKMPFPLLFNVEASLLIQKCICSDFENYCTYYTEVCTKQS